MLFAKQDMADAYEYKLVPTGPQFWHYFGFKWLGKFFCALTTVFGNCAAPAHFGDFAETVVQLAITRSKIPRRWVTRHLDDTIIVAPAGTNYAQEFLASF